MKNKGISMSNAGSLNIDRKYVGFIPLKEDMEYFDNLPEELQKFVNEFPYKLNSYVVRRIYDKYGSVESVRSVIWQLKNQHGL